MKNLTICILGGGSWGATIASHLAKKKYSVRLWEFMESQVEVMRQTRTLPFLPQIKIPESVFVTSNLKSALDEATVVFSIVPSQFVRSTWKNVKKESPKLDLIVSFSKGIESESLKRMSEIIQEEFPESEDKLAVLSGPSHAEEVAIDIPTAVVVASEVREIAEQAQEILVSPNFRVYTNPDIIGVETGGALKNIFAIATGACDGLHLGDNTKAALITRGLNEMAKVGIKMGAIQETFFGLAGMGDLVVTCLSQHSRNRLLGEKVGSGKPVAEALKEMTMVAEGYPTAKSAYQLIQKYKCDCPLIVEIYHVLYEGKNIQESMRDLMTRPLCNESENLEWQ